MVNDVFNQAAGAFERIVLIIDEGIGMTAIRFEEKLGRAPIMFPFPGLNRKALRQWSSRAPFTIPSFRTRAFSGKVVGA